MIMCASIVLTVLAPNIKTCTSKDEKTNIIHRVEILTLIFENNSITFVNSVVVSPQVVEKFSIVVVILKHYL